MQKVSEHNLLLKLTDSLSTGLTYKCGINNVFNENYYSYVGNGFSTEGRVFYTRFKYEIVK